MRRVFALVGFVWLAALPYLTAQRASVFHSNSTLWRDAVARNPDMVRPHLNYADALWKDSTSPAASDQLFLAKELLPDAPLAAHKKRGYTFLVNIELGSFARAAGRMDEAQDYFMAAAIINPEFAALLQGGAQ